MKKVILLTLTIFSIVNIADTLAIDANNNSSTHVYLPEEIWHSIFEIIINPEIKDKIKSAETIPTLKRVVNEIYKSYFPISKIHNRIFKGVLNKYYIQRKSDIIQEIKKILERIYPCSLLSFKDISDINAIIDDWPILHSAVFNNNKQIAELLTKNGANLDIQNNDGETALMYAIQLSNKDITELLIQNGASLDIKRASDDSTALMLTAFKNSKDMAELLIQNGADINIQNKLGNTALMIAVLGNSREVVELLIKYGAKLDIKNNSGNKALMIALNKGHKEIAELIEKEESKNSNNNNYKRAKKRRKKS